jgi:hypothetical protein
MDERSLERARAAKQHALELFSQLGDVVGIGLTRIGEEYGLKVNLRSARTSLGALPSEVDGVRVTVEVVGPIRKRPR